jgi:hypothetical protein
VEAHQQHSGFSESDIKVREVTHYQFSWTERAPGEHGVFSLQLILDEGAEEHVVRPTADDCDALHDMLQSEAKIYFDLDRRVLMFGVNATG